LADLRTSGFNRLYQRGNIFEFSTPESLLELDFTLPVFVLLDRIVVSAENRARIVDACEIAYRESGEVVLKRFHARRPRSESGTDFQANSSALAATGRQGAGASSLQLQQPLRRVSSLPRIRQYGGLRPEPGHSRQGAELGDGAIDPWNRPKYRPWFADLRKQAPELGVR